MSMAFHKGELEAERVIAATSQGLGPVFDGLARGALAVGFLGLGVGGVATEMLKAPFNASTQWGSPAAAPCWG